MKVATPDGNLRRQLRITFRLCITSVPFRVRFVPVSRTKSDMKMADGCAEPRIPGWEFTNAAVPQFPRPGCIEWSGALARAVDRALH